MAIIKDVVIDQITVIEDGTILCREATRIVEDGVLLTQTYHRSSVVPGQDLSGHANKVVAIANATWTPEIIAAYQAEQARIQAAAFAQAEAEAAAQQGA